MRYVLLAVLATLDIVGFVQSGDGYFSLALGLVGFFAAARWLLRRGRDVRVAPIK